MPQVTVPPRFGVAARREAGLSAIVLAAPTAVNSRNSRRFIIPLCPSLKKTGKRWYGGQLVFLIKCVLRVFNPGFSEGVFGLEVILGVEVFESVGPGGGHDFLVVGKPVGLVV